MIYAMYQKSDILPYTNQKRGLQTKTFGCDGFTVNDVSTASISHVLTLFGMFGRVDSTCTHII